MLVDCSEAMSMATAAFFTSVDPGTWASWLKLLTIFLPPGPILGPFFAATALIKAGEEPESRPEAFNSKQEGKGFGYGFGISFWSVIC